MSNMDDSPEELTLAQTEELVAVLEGLRTELTAYLAASGDRTATVDLDQPIGRLSRMDALQQQAMAKEQRRRVELRLAKVKQSLTAAAAGDYGLCRRCEEPIGHARLKARPESPFCLACRSEIEQGH